MRIGIDGSCWTNARGYGRFTRELVPALVAQAPAHEFVCFCDPQALEAFDLRAPNVRTVEVRTAVAPTRAAAADGYRSPLDMLRFTAAVAREKLDVFFSPSVYTYFPLPPGLSAVVTIHDAITERFPELTLPTPRARLFWRLKVGLAIRQARLVLTVSDFAARELNHVLGIPADRIRIAVEAPAPAYRPADSPAEAEAAAERLGLPPGARWFVYVGGFNPHKDVDVLARAHAAVARAAAGAPPYLVLVGPSDRDVFHTGLDRIHAAIAESGTAELVRWPGFLPDEVLRHVLAGAVALVLPSRAEGFGLPAVEAAACGTPVIATTASPLPGLLEGGGIFLPPGDVDGLAAAMRAMLEDEPRRRAMGERALERARRLSWQASARAALDALLEAAGAQTSSTGRA